MVEIIAELSCNHLGDYQRALRLVDAAVAAGADAIKLQVDDPEGGLTIDCDAEPFRIWSGPWAGRTLHDLYRETYTPWEWVPKLMAYSPVEVFATPSCPRGVAFLEHAGVKRYKVSSFEITDIPLLQAIADTGKPVMVSLGCATNEDIERVIDIIPRRKLTLMHCVSEYPARIERSNLGRLRMIAHDTDLRVGLSDHSVGNHVSVMAVALGAVAIEKHLMLDGTRGPDSGFSATPDEFRAMVGAVRTSEEAMMFRDTEPDRQFVKSLFVVKDVAKGERFTSDNVGVIRPGYGLHPMHLCEVLTRRAARDVKRGEPIAWGMVG